MVNAASNTAPTVNIPQAPTLSVVPKVAPAAMPLGSPRLGGVFEITQGTLQVLEGRPGGWGAVALGTTLRAGLIAGGFYLTGERDLKRLAFGSLAASGIVTVVLFAGHAVMKRAV